MTTLMLWVVTASVVTPPASAHASARPSATDDLAARVFAPTATSQPELGTPRPAFVVTKAAAERGSYLFIVKGCVLCHGQRAEGQFGPRIARTILSFDDVRRQARTPRNVYMPQFTSDLLAEQEITDIYAFLQSLPGD